MAPTPAPIPSNNDPQALHSVAVCHERGYGVAADVAEVIRWHMRAQAADDTRDADTLQRLGA